MSSRALHIDALPATTGSELTVTVCLARSAERIEHGLVLELYTPRVVRECQTARCQHEHEAVEGKQATFAQSFESHH